ncbi:hypothetical protein D3C72_2062160 [compost metagenome]
MIPGMPEQVDLDFRQRERMLDVPEPEVPGASLRKRQGHRGDQVGGGDDVRQCDEMGDTQPDLALYAVLGEDLVDPGMPRPRRRDHDVLRRLEGAHADRLLVHGMTGPEQANVSLAK